jgi:hypothetical protein
MTASIFTQNDTILAYFVPYLYRVLGTYEDASKIGNHASKSSAYRQGVGCMYVAMVRV